MYLNYIYIAGTPAVVGIIQRPESCPGLQAGDVISKINGKAIGNLGFAGVVNCIKQLNRPIVIHFVQALGDMSLVTMPTGTTSSSSRTTSPATPATPTTPATSTITVEGEVRDSSSVASSFVTVEATSST